MIYSKRAIDYSQGTKIFDPKTKKVYSEKEARNLPLKIRRRLINKPRKMGAYVLTLKECDDILQNRRDEKWTGKKKDN